MNATVSVYNSIAKTYAKNIEDYYSATDRDTFLSLVSNRGKILDVGCAAGRDSRYFDSKGFDVIGVDLSEKLLEIAKQKAPHIDFQMQDIRNLNFPENSFDGIYASAVLLHLQREEVAPVLGKLHDLLRLGGVVFIQVKEGEGEADVAEQLSAGSSRHFTYFSKDEVESLLQHAGFTVQKIHTFNEKDINPNWRNLNWISSLAIKK